MTYGKTKKVLSLIAALSLAGVVLAAAPAKKSPFPWIFGGYEKIETLHLKYWSPAKDVFSDPKGLMKPNFRTEICEVWFSKGARSFRVDKYVEKTTVKCNQFKSKPWEIITEKGVEYVLKERIIQTGTTRSFWHLENIASGGGKELCEYKRFDGSKPDVKSVRTALLNLTIAPYLADPQFEEMDVSLLELNPEEHKAALQEFKKTYDKAGRKTVKYNKAHGIREFHAEGPIYIDLEWGMGLEGYIAKTRTGREQPVEMAPPVCIYKVLSIDTTIDDLKVFDKE